MSGLLFVVAAAVVWVSGSRLSEYVDLLADRWNLGRAFAGAVLLGGATSLPELATTVTAVASGATQLAGANLLGGVVVQMAVLATVDAVMLRDRALTFYAPTAGVLVQGVFVVLLAATAGAAVSSGELVTVAGLGLWPVVLAGLFVVGLRVVKSVESEPRWQPTGGRIHDEERPEDVQDDIRRRHGHRSTSALVARFGVAALGVLVSGSLVAITGEAIAETTGIGASFVGATAVSVATSLPEITTTAAAVRIGAYSMATANILGSNALLFALFLPADLVHRDGAFVDSLGPSSAYLACLGIVVTAIHLWGVIERRDRTVLGMGHDSLAVLIVAIAGLGVYATL